jgi:hypothetical protein
MGVPTQCASRGLRSYVHVCCRTLCCLHFHCCCIMPQAPDHLLQALPTLLLLLLLLC